MIAKPQFNWELGTAYDLFISLDVLHEPARFGLRGNWAAGVRSRLPTKQREFLQDVLKYHHVWTIPWLISLPQPKNSETVLGILEEIPPARRLPDVMGAHMNQKYTEILYPVAEQGKWNEDDKQALYDLKVADHKKEGKKKKVSDDQIEMTLNIWANPAKFGEDWLGALNTYYEVFFHEEEARILSGLVQSTIQAQALAEQLPFAELLNELSQGLRFDCGGTENIKELIMIPSFWTTPLTYLGKLGEDEERWVFVFGGRPSGMSLVPGELVPELLHNTLKALADPTRLRILKYLSEEPLTPAELARRLRLRPPTVSHHLDALRLARLVHVTLSKQGRRYEARREAIDATCALLDGFLNGELPDL